MIHRNYNLDLEFSNIEELENRFSFEKNFDDNYINITANLNKIVEIVINNKYRSLYPLVFYVNGGKDGPIFPDQELILLYNQVSVDMMRYYTLFYKSFENNELRGKKILCLTTIVGPIEAFLYYNKSNNLLEPNSFIFINTTHIDTMFNGYKEHINSSIDKLKRYYKKTKIDYLTDEDEIMIFNPKKFKELEKKLDLVDISLIETQYVYKTTFLRRKQLYFSDILLSLRKLRNNGSLILSFSFMDFDQGFIKEILYLLDKYFDSKELFSPKIKPTYFFIILKGFKGLPKKDSDILFNILEKWYQLDPSGGKKLGYSNNSLNQKYDLFTDYRSGYNDKFVRNLFNFNYNKDYDKVFDKIISRLEYLKQVIETSKNRAKIYNIKTNSEEYKDFESKQKRKNIKGSIKLAKKFELEIKPKFLDISKKYQERILERIYTIDRSIIHPFARYHRGCSLRFNKDENYKYVIEDIYNIKKKLLIHKFYMDTINIKKWEKIAYKTNLPYHIRKYVEKIFNIPNVTRAFLKMYEILTEFPSLTNVDGETVNCLHICEAPGKFIEATNYFIKTQTNKKYKWNANSLNPFSHEVKRRYGSMFGDNYGYMKKYPQNWLWGKDNTGDITDPENLRNITSRAKNNLGKINIFTSDCGLSVSEDYNEQEMILSVLNLSQTIGALMALEKGGHAVLKVFIPMAESISISLVYLLYCTFTRVSIVKQLSGSSISSEVYLVCENMLHLPSKDLMDYLQDFLKTYKMGNALFPKDQYPEDFMKQYQVFIKDFFKQQTKALSTTYYYYDYPEILEKHLIKIDRYKEERARNFVETMNMKNMDRKDLL